MTEAVRERDRQVFVHVPRGLTFSGARIASPTTGWRIADSLLAVIILTALVVVGNLGQMPGGVEEFLAIRISIKNVLLLTAFGLGWPLILSVCGLYTPARLRSGQGEAPRLLLASAIGGVLAILFPMTSQSGAVRPEHALLFALAAAPAAAALRGTVRAVQRASRGVRRRQIVIVGSGPLAARMYQDLQADPLGGCEVVGFVDSEPHPALGGIGGPAHLGGVAELDQILMHRVVDDVLIGLPIKSRYEEIQQSLGACARVGVPAKYPADLFRSTLGIPMADGRIATPILSLLSAPEDHRLLIKRGFDVVGAVVLLVLLSPLMLGVALLVRLTSTGPVFFAQERYGYMKRRFRMHKFRTMVVGAEQLQGALEDRNEVAGPLFKIREDPRLTVVGRFLRRSSLDELPQLWNVLTGEMSLVGPRPLPVRDVGRFAEPWLMRRFSMRPGLTCLWQIHGRSSLAIDRWITLDLQYIDTWSLTQDFVILVKTLPAVLRGVGAS
jgi:exopolysaccharide biosynthesis polyprenyl glycosylphosphotransferase